MGTETQSVPVLGELPKNWRVRRFGDLLIGSSRNGVYKSKEFHGRGAKIVNMGELFANPRLYDVPMKRLELGESELLKSSLQAGDLLFARRSLVAEGAGKCSVVCQVTEPTTFESSIIRARPNPELADSHYLYYLFSSDYGTYLMSSILRQVAVSGITGTDLVELPIPTPPLPEQKRIAHILGTLDDKIELNRKMNATLEAMARALFKSWFVDFDPVRAKMEGRQPEGMDAATAALFPDSFEESELGLVPKGWGVGSIYTVADVIYGAPFSSKLFNTDRNGAPLIRIRDLKDESPGVWTPESHPKGYLVKHGDIVVGMDGEFRAHLWGGEPAWLNQRVCVFAPKSGFSSAFVRNSIMAPLAEVEATEIATTVIHLGKNDIDRFKVVLPPQAVHADFKKICQPWYERIVINKRMSRTLSEARDTLLPKMIGRENL